MFDALVDLDRYPVDDAAMCVAWQHDLDSQGALVLREFFRPRFVEAVLSEVLGREHEAFFAVSTHNVWLTDPDPTLGPHHVVNRQICSTKGLLADDQIRAGSPLRLVYTEARFRSFIARLVGLEAVYPYDDALSSVNVHFHRDGEELGWHFDNSGFAVTALMQAPDDGGVFEFVPDARDTGTGIERHDLVEAVLDGQFPVRTLSFTPGDLVLFRGRDALHRVTPSAGERTRVLVVFAFNERPGVRLSDSAKQTFYGRLD